VILVDSGPLVPAGTVNDPHQRVHGVARLCTEELLMPVEAPDVGGASPLQRSGQAGLRAGTRSS
jgi:hypothetical protein